MKYLLILLLSFLLTHPVYAARQVQGTVPNVRPLQPMPEGIGANLQNNVQFQDASYSEEGEGVNPSGSVQNSGSSSSAPGGQEPGQVTAPAAGSGSSFIFWTIIVLVLIGLGWWGYRRSKS